LYLLFSKGQLSGGDGVSYDFNMASLADHLKKQSEQGSSTYYNIDIIKYEVRIAVHLAIICNWMNKINFIFTDDVLLVMQSKNQLLLRLWLRNTKP